MDLTIIAAKNMINGRSNTSPWKSGNRTQMNKKAIKSTTIIRWSDEDDCFIAMSPLLDSVIGVGDSEAEALEEFSDILDDAYEAYIEGKLKYDTPGRPAKNRIALNVDVQASTKNSIKVLAVEKECSQGEIVDFLLASHLLLKKTNQKNSVEAKPSVNASGMAPGAETRLKALEDKISEFQNTIEILTKKTKK